MKKIIETAIPLSSINADAIKEKAGSTGHPGNLHNWWNRSPISSILPTLLAAIMDDQNEFSDELLAILKSTKIKEKTTEGLIVPTVYDPFCGFGAIPIAAQQLGIHSHASDMNPVATILTMAATSIPAKFKNCPPTHPGFDAKPRYGAEGLAEDVRWYGKWMQDEAAKRLQKLYPMLEDSQESPVAWIWTRTVKCPNPACSCQMPLASSFVLSKKRGSEFWAEPIVIDGKAQFVVHKGVCPEGKESNKCGATGAQFKCPACGEITTDAYIKKMGQSHKLGSQMIAIVADINKQRTYIAPTVFQEKAANVPLPQDIPNGSIPNYSHWFSPPGFGLTEYSDLFTARQLTMLTTFCDLLIEVQNKVVSDALSTSFSESGDGLTENGVGALAYGQAVSIYLALAIDKLTEFHSSVCSWRNANGNIRGVFGRQSIPMVWTFAEGNPFSAITGNWDSIVNNISDTVAALPCNSCSIVEQADAVQNEYPQNVLVCTELPYYRDVAYSELSDYFYIWLRRSLRSIFPSMLAPMVVNKDEMTSLSLHYGNQKEADKAYENKLNTVCKKIEKAQHPDYPACIFFTIRKGDIKAIESTVLQNGLTAWEKFLTFLIEAGFKITATWPTRSETASEKADAIRMLVVCRKREASGNTTTRRNFISVLTKELPDRLNSLLSGNIADEDIQLSGMGCGLAVFTEYSKVLNADGTGMSLHDTLQIIWQQVASFMEKQNEEEESNV